MAGKGAITVTIDIERYFDGRNIKDLIEEKIVNAAVEQMHEELSKLVQAKVMELADKEFTKMVKTKLDEFFTKPMAETNHWGEPTGKTHSLRDLFLDKCNKWLADKVNDKGEADNYRANQTRAEWLLKTVAHEPLQQAVNETVKQIAGKAREQIQASVSRYIAEQLAPTISVPQLKQ